MDFELFIVTIMAGMLAAGAGLGTDYIITEFCKLYGEIKGLKNE